MARRIAIWRSQREGAEWAEKANIQADGLPSTRPQAVGLDMKREQRESLSHDLLEPVDGFFDIRATVEGAEPEVSFAAGAETTARGADEVGLLE